MLLSTNGMEKFEWDGGEYESHERSPDWYWGVGFVALLSAAASVYFANYLFAVVILLAAFSLIMLSIQKPAPTDYAVSDEGIRVGESLYPWRSLESFWVEEEGLVPKIIAVSKKVFMPYLIIPIVGHDPKTIRELLAKHLQEKEHHEPLLHALGERLGL